MSDTYTDSIEEFPSAARPKFRIIRKLGHMEKFQAAQHLLRTYVGCAISSRYMIPEALLASDQSVENTVETAFARAILQHPLFTVARKHDDSKRPFWVRLKSIDFNNHIEWRKVNETENCDDLVQEVLEWQINHPFTHLETQPHWRSVILKPANSNFVEIVFAWDHTAGDGRSGKIFHDSLLASFNALADGKEAGPALKDRVFDVPVTALTPQLHSVLKFPLSWGFLFSEVRHAAKGSPEPTDSPYAATWAAIKKPCTTRQSTISVEKDALLRVLELCRQNKTTLTGLAHALALVSMATRLPKDKAPAFQSGTPICMRGFDNWRTSKHSNLNLERTVMNSVTYWGYKYDEDVVAKIRQQANDLKTSPESNTDLEATIWSVATAVRQGISERLALGTKNDTIGLMKFVGDWRAHMKKLEMNQRRTYAWEISNLGVINGGGEKWAIERATFSQSAAVAGSAVGLSMIAVKGKALAISCCWQVEVIDDGLARGLLSDLETWLNQLGRTGNISFVVE
ncbi:hypothetical protein ACHAPT_003814 [Fusarium lateritium]